MTEQAVKHPWVIPWDDARKRVHARGFAMPFINPDLCGSEVLRVHMSVINPGEESHAPHTHAGEDVTFILEGTGLARIGEEEIPVGPLTALFAPEGVLHGLRNTGDTPIKYLVIRTSA